MRKGLELVLDKIESRIGKRSDFLVDDVMNYFLQDEGIIEMSLNELEHYARTGEREEKAGVFEYGACYQPGGKFQGKYRIYDKSLLLSKEYLSKKYGEKYKQECLNCREKHRFMEWVEAGGIVIATLDYKHILCLEIESNIGSWEEVCVATAFMCMRKFDDIELPSEDEKVKEREWWLGYYWDHYERKALETFG